MVFQRLQAHNLKLFQIKCHFMKSPVKFLGHIVSSESIATDPEKARSIVDITEQDHMEDGTDIPSQAKIRSYLGIVVFDQQYFEDCCIGKPLFALTSDTRRPRHSNGQKRVTTGKKRTSLELTPECRDAFNSLKQALLEKVVLAHPDFSKPFLLSVDASGNVLGVVLSQVAEGGEIGRPIAFASNLLVMSVDATGFYYTF